ncbi:hypothetical protein [Bremerella sp. P1]|uniref:hypothetical protein n=1 Tax=Bremerella sp. P1 TaxID=3026424 RepID=UPI0023680C32|nr:hypothetical protein [Bremerella sp. P1]WDI43477.1 hypothetical protein PSR63_05900 [Bremerella sp. P1]
MNIAWRTLCILLTACLAASISLSWPGTAVAQDRTTPVSAVKPDNGRRQVAQAPVSDQRISLEERKRREEVALAFAKKHHPELEKLLRQLRGMDQKEYAKAVRELYRVSERLSPLESRAPRFYEVQLDLWKANSSATLLAARLQLNPGNEDLRQEFRAALLRKFETQKRVNEEELVRARERVQRLEQNLERLERDGPQMIERQLRQLTPKNRSNTQ